MTQWVNVSSIQTLRSALDGAGLTSVEIVAADGSFEGIAEAVMKDSDLSKAVNILG